MACKAWYQVETLAKGDPPEGETRDDYTYRLRQEHSVPLLTAFKTWLDEQAPHVLPESLLVSDPLSASTQRRSERGA